MRISGLTSLAKALHLSLAVTARSREVSLQASGGIALILAVESGALKFRSEQAETTAVGIGVVAILGCGIGIVAGGLERVMKE